MKPVKVTGIAKKAGIVVSDDILSFDGNIFTDALDLIYAEGNGQSEVIIKTSDGRRRKILLKDETGEGFGLDFGEKGELSPPRVCRNNCVFCFVSQLPKGMRKSLYVKDDDYRLSFACGTYVTLTNLSEADEERILRYKLSPLFISLHASNKEVRCKLLGLKSEPRDCLKIIEGFVANGIKLNLQIVLVPGYNDGEILRETLQYLLDLGENIISVAVVPVGLTAHRERLTPLKPVDVTVASECIAITEEFYNKREFFAFCSDEMYEIAQKPVPSFDYYGDFSQIDNGVGLIAKFLNEVTEACEFWEGGRKKKVKIGFITGVSGESSLKKATEIIKGKFKNFSCDIFVIKNKFFGETVTVSGLITGNDIIEQLKSVDMSQYDKVLVPSVMLKEFETVFLDGMSVADISTALGANLVPVFVDGDELLAAVFE
ncbi:MAG: DUF512 domain-containing protein [Christensenellaceae bacterium]|nr:DUF512 domain-containing protein [Christensenellaceae bacterium]